MVDERSPGHGRTAAPEVDDGRAAAPEERRIRSAMRAHLLLAMVVLLVGCEPRPSAANGVLDIHAVAGPVCPVETDPPDPDCAPRDVEGATIRVARANAPEEMIASGVTDANGRLALAVAAGDYVVVGSDAEGLMGAPPPAEVSVRANGTASVALLYDTGIR